jgi:GntR family transcriptional regulator / MocR family aminotransferase
MRIPLDSGSAVPLYRQVQQYLETAIKSQVLAEGTRLPSSRELSALLGVNRITITSAYEGLEADGWVRSRRGSGTYVAVRREPVDEPARPQEDWPLWQQELQNRAWTPGQYELDQIATRSNRAESISFAAGMGDSSLFPLEDFRRVLQTTLRRDGRDALGYGDRAGYLPLRATIAGILADQGVAARAESVLVTSGSQQGMALVARLLIRPGDTVLVESPTYPGAIDLFRSLGARLAGVPLDGQGIEPSRLEEVLAYHRPKLIYTMPTFQNPTGVGQTLERRRKVIELAGRYDVPILEDDFVGDLRYEGRAEPPLAALDPGGRVIYMGTFSKMLMPGLRLGFLMATGPVYERLLAAKRVDDLSTSSLIQRALEAYITVGRYHAHLRRAVQLNRQRRDAMLSALQSHLPDGCSWTVPQGGLFVWLRLPAGMASDDLLPVAAESGVLFAPGSFFYSGGRPQAYLRLNFVEHTAQEIGTGIERLAAAMRRLQAQLELTTQPPAESKREPAQVAGGRVAAG